MTEYFHRLVTFQQWELDSLIFVAFFGGFFLASLIAWAGVRRETKLLRSISRRYDDLAEAEAEGDEITHPTRCQIIDPGGASLGEFVALAPEISRPHIGKFGTARLTDGDRVEVTLDDGTILAGLDCWWTPLPEASTVEGQAGELEAEP